MDVARRFSQMQHPLVKLPISPGQFVNAREIDFEIVSEPWTVYELKDGGRMRHRSVVSKLYRIYDDSEDPQPRSDDQGEPMIFVVSNAMSVSSQ